MREDENEMKNRVEYIKGVLNNAHANGIAEGSKLRIPLRSEGLK